MLDDAALDRLMEQVDAQGLQLLGPDGVLTELTSKLLNRAMAAELTEHLGYEHGDRAGWGSGNSRNGTSPKTVLTDAGPVPVAVPRDRQGSFEPKLVGKHQRRLDGFNDIVIGLVARGLSTRDVASHIREAYGAEVSAELISKITDAVLPELRAWQTRPLDAIYPIMYLDAIVVKVRSEHVVANRPVYLAMGIDLEGRKHVLGMWLGTGGEGSKFWLGVCTELRNRGVGDVLIVCCDGLSGFPEAIEATWPQATVQTCVVHLIRASMRFVSYKDRKKVAAALKLVYTAPTPDAAEQALLEFQDSELGQRYPATAQTWLNAWERFIPFLEFPPALRKVIYTTNSIESLNYQLRKIIKNRGHFPTDTAVVKLLWLAIRDIEDKRARQRAKEAGKKANERRAPGRLVEGATVNGWKACLGALAMAYPDRIADRI
ncbi:MAG: IS256 family transposase [Actinobacteria bacterium]|nr:IS256 family transposase [Actinomycetota bacterium]